MVNRFELSGHTIGGRNPCFIIAEAGVNHNGNLEMAHRLVDASASSGADCVKFQTWITEEICAPGTAKAEYQKDSTEAEDQFSMLKRLELPFEWHEQLKEHAERRGIIFLSTPDEIDSARFLCKLGVPALKIGSAEITNLPYLADLAALGKPLILSTGMADLSEIAAAVIAIEQVSPGLPVALLHCVSAYPAPEDEMNLRCMTTIRGAFPLPVGLSDHTTGTTAATLGTALGMAVYERHITLDRQLPGPDQAASTEPAEFAALVAAIRKAERMLGSGIKRPSKSEIEVSRVVRRVLAFHRLLEPGHTIIPGDITALRCGVPGIQPSELGTFTGCVLQRQVAAGTPVCKEDFA